MEEAGAEARDRVVADAEQVEGARAAELRAAPQLEELVPLSQRAVFGK